MIGSLRRVIKILGRYMSRTIKEVCDRAIDIKKEYSKIEPKKWEVEQAFMGMVKDVGDLSELLMVEGGYRKSEKSNKELIEHELADVLYCLCILSNRLDIDLEESFFRTMQQLEEKLSKRKINAE